MSFVAGATKDFSMKMSYAICACKQTLLLSWDECDFKNEPNERRPFSPVSARHKRPKVETAGVFETCCYSRTHSSDWRDSLHCRPLVELRSAVPKNVERPLSKGVDYDCTDQRVDSLRYPRSKRT